MRIFWIRIFGIALIFGLLAGCAPAGANIPTDLPLSPAETQPVAVTENPPAPLEPTATPIPTEPVAPQTSPSQAPPTPAGDRVPAIITEVGEEPGIPLGTPAPTTPPDWANNPIVKQAIQDLATQLNISEDEIEVLGAKSVTWPDGALGCPQPGMAYIQVMQEGMLIKLGVGEEIYEYHSGENRPPFQCTNPQ